LANIKSAQKRVLVAEIKRKKNAANKSEMRTAIKKYYTAMDSSAEDTKQLMSEAVSVLDKNVSRGTIHKKTAARKKSRLMQAYNKSLA